MKFLQASIHVFKKLGLLPPYYPLTVEEFFAKAIVRAYGTMKE